MMFQIENFFQFKVVGRPMETGGIVTSPVTKKNIRSVTETKPTTKGCLKFYFFNVKKVSTVLSYKLCSFVFIDPQSRKDSFFYLRSYIYCFDPTRRAFVFFTCFFMEHLH